MDVDGRLLAICQKVICYEGKRDVIETELSTNSPQTVIQVRKKYGSDVIQTLCNLYSEIQPTTGKDLMNYFLNAGTLPVQAVVPLASPTVAPAATPPPIPATPAAAPQVPTRQPATVPPEGPAPAATPPPTPPATVPPAPAVAPAAIPSTVPLKSVAPVAVAQSPTDTWEDLQKVRECIQSLLPEHPQIPLAAGGTSDDRDDDSGQQKPKRQRIVDPRTTSTQTMASPLSVTDMKILIKIDPFIVFQFPFNPDYKDVVELLAVPDDPFVMYCVTGSVETLRFTQPFIQYAQAVKLSTTENLFNFSEYCSYCLFIGLLKSDGSINANVASVDADVQRLFPSAGENIQKLMTALLQCYTDKEQEVSYEYVRCCLCNPSNYKLLPNSYKTSVYMYAMTRFGGSTIGDYELFHWWNAEVQMFNELTLSLGYSEKNANFLTVTISKKYVNNGESDLEITGEYLFVMKNINVGPYHPFEQHRVLALVNEELNKRVKHGQSLKSSEETITSSSVKYKHGYYDVLRSHYSHVENMDDDHSKKHQSYRCNSTPIRLVKFSCTSSSSFLSNDALYLLASIDQPLGYLPLVRRTFKIETFQENSKTCYRDGVEDYTPAFTQGAYNDYATCVDLQDGICVRTLPVAISKDTQSFASALLHITHDVVLVNSTGTEREPPDQWMYLQAGSTQSYFPLCPCCALENKNILLSVKEIVTGKHAVLLVPPAASKTSMNELCVEDLLPYTMSCLRWYAEQRTFTTVDNFSFSAWLVQYWGGIGTLLVDCVYALCNFRMDNVQNSSHVLCSAADETRLILALQMIKSVEVENMSRVDPEKLIDDQKTYKEVQKLLTISGTQIETVVVNWVRLMELLSKANPFHRSVKNVLLSQGRLIGLIPKLKLQDEVLTYYEQTPDLYSWWASDKIDVKEPLEKHFWLATFEALVGVNLCFEKKRHWGRLAMWWTTEVVRQVLQISDTNDLLLLLIWFNDNSLSPEHVSVENKFFRKYSDWVKWNDKRGEWTNENVKSPKTYKLLKNIVRQIALVRSAYLKLKTGNEPKNVPILQAQTLYVISALRQKLRDQINTTEESPAQKGLYKKYLEQSKKIPPYWATTYAGCKFIIEHCNTIMGPVR